MVKAHRRVKPAAGSADNSEGAAARLLTTAPRYVMESQEDIDALLAEASALAEEAVAEVGGDMPGGSLPPATPAPMPPPPTPSAAHKPAPPVGAGLGGSVPPSIERILRLEVPVIVRLAERTMAMREILGLSTGAIIEFDKPSDSQLDLMINNQCIGQGQAVKLGENFGLRVTQVGTVQDRIRAMGKP